MYYKITLKPLAPFFFGGEHNFSEGKGYDQYYSRSEQFPQQTQLLGMLRKTILFNEGYLKAYPKGDFIPKNKKEEAHKVVGSKWRFGSIPDLKKIVFLSPVFLSYKDKLYMPAPLDTGLSLKKEEGEAYYNGKLKNPYRLYSSPNTPLDSKTHLYDGFIDTRGNLKESSQIFKPVEQVGNRTRYEGGVYENAYYKKRSFSFADEAWGFTFYLKQAGIKEIPATLVFLGADRSKFRLTMEKVDTTEYDMVFNEVIKKQALSKIVLMSDAYVTEEMLEKVDFYIGYTRPFRYAENESMKDEENGKKKFRFKRSDRVYLLTRGSVLFFGSKEEANTFSNKLKEEKSMYTIGYNHHIIAQGEQNVH